MTARRKHRRPYAAKWQSATEGGEVEIWGDGKQTRSFLYIDVCLEGTLRLMRSNFTGPVNIGSDEMVYYRSAGRHRRWHREQVGSQALHRRPHRCSRSQVRQSFDSPKARMGALDGAR